VIRLFLKLYGVLIATLVCSFLVQGWLMEYVWREMSAGFDFRARYRPTFHLIEEALAPLPQERWAARYSELAAGFSLPSRLADAASLPERASFKPEQAAAFERGAIVSLEREGGGFKILKRLRGSPSAVVLELPGPDQKRVKMVTYVVNWTVEFAIVAVLVFFWVRPFWRDLRSLQGAAEAVGAGQLEARARVGGRLSALRPVSGAFNAMAERIAHLLQSHRGLTSAVSHELRTPLARLRFSHSLAREAQDAATKERFLARMERDIAEIDELTRELLDYARLERGMPEIGLESVPTEPWLEDVLAEARPPEGAQAPMAALDADVTVEAMRCEPRYMARAVLNMVRNALRHARSRVRICITREQDRTVIHVDDDGAGVPAPDRERIFEPFVRLDRSRDRESGGFGLGLAIVRQVARWHGGDATISDSPLGGARVTIAW
jgi:two-component system, OmpR family, sensor kinase ParS